MCFALGIVARPGYILMHDPKPLRRTVRVHYVRSNAMLAAKTTPFQPTLSQTGPEPSFGRRRLLPKPAAVPGT